VLSIVWLQHHWIFRHIDKVDNVIFVLNIALLMVVVFFPLPTGMLAAYLKAGQFQTTAAAIYGATLVATTLLVSLMWLSVSTRRHKVATKLGSTTAKTMTLRILLAPALYAVGLGVSLVNVVAGICCYVAIALLQLALLRPSLLNRTVEDEEASEVAATASTS
jgi:uncharacterized membrane protein